MNSLFMLHITAIPAFRDNYFWAITQANRAVIVDPGDAAPVEAFLSAHKLELAAIFVTHWHADHIAGIEHLVRGKAIPVYGPHSTHIPHINTIVSDGDSIDILDTTFSVLAVPGHTLDHIAYYNAENHAVFCGDTVFGGGCGRIFEGTPAMMFASINKLASLPDKTRLYCAHEYTLQNLRFGLEVEPDNLALHERLIECTKLREENRCTLPSTIGLEKQTNPFLRCNEISVITQALNQGADSDKPVDVFTCIRAWKDDV